MYKHCNVVMLPSNKKTNGMICRDISGIDKRIAIKISNFMEHEDYIGQHLYITSEEKIKEGDWIYLNIFQPEIKQVIDKEDANWFKVAKNDWKKIIATTDTSLITGEIWDNLKETVNEFVESGKLPKSNKQLYLPQPSKQFIQHFIEEYNKGNVIIEIEAEYTYELSNDEDEQGNLIPDIYLKVNPDNTINIKPIKESWSREEVIGLFHKYKIYHDGEGSYYKDILNKWIEENL